MKQLSSTLSKPRRRIYGLLTVGLLVAFVATAVGGIIFGLGHSRSDVVMPFWECGEYVLLLGVVNLGLFGALFWQVSRFSRREARRPAPERPSVLLPVAGEAANPAGLSPGKAPATPVSVNPPPGLPRRVSRQVRGTPSSLRLDS